MDKRYLIIVDGNYTGGQVNDVLKAGGLRSCGLSGQGVICIVNGNVGFNNSGKDCGGGNWHIDNEWYGPWTPENTVVLMAAWFIKNPSLVHYWKKPKFKVAKDTVLQLVSQRYNIPVEEIELVD